jgi:radical SAM superfamily enzyme YgiQ (UPF0313 family)
MFFVPIQYNEPVFRPPGEAQSVILQATIGCSWNKCAFCEMYTSKKFATRPFEQIKSDIEKLAKIYSGVRKVFLADGDAFVLSSNKLIPILEEINIQFGKTQRISSYALPKDIITKSDEELLQLKNHGLKLLYIGIETGDDELLKLINKGESFQSTVEGILKAHNAGIETSIMIINGLGGKKFSHQHAVRSAEIINQINPKFLSTLTLSMPFGLDHFKNRFAGDYQQQSIKELFEELKLFIENLNVSNVIYRSDHVSNNLVLKGVLSKDKDVLINQIIYAISSIPDNTYPITSAFL